MMSAVAAIIPYVSLEDRLVEIAQRSVDELTVVCNDSPIAALEVAVVKGAANAREWLVSEYEAGRLSRDELFQGLSFVGTGVTSGCLLVRQLQPPHGVRFKRGGIEDVLFPEDRRAAS